MSESDDRLLAKLAELKRRRLEGGGAAQPARGLRRGPDAAGNAGGGNAGGGRRGAFLRELLKERGEGGNADGAGGKEGGKRGEVLRRILERRAAEDGGAAGERPLARLLQRRLDERGDAAGAMNPAMSPAESAAAIERLEQLVSRLEGRLAELDGKSSGGASPEGGPSADTDDWPSQELSSEEPPAQQPATQMNMAEPRTGAAERIAARRRADAANKK